MTEYSDEAQPELVDGGEVPQDRLPERMLLGTEVVSAHIAGYEVAAIVLTLVKREDDAEAEGLVCISTREEALTLAAQLRSVAPTLKTMQSQLEARNITPQGESNDNG